MAKEKARVQIGLSVEGDEIKLNISEEVRQRIPRAGDALHVIQPYPVDEDDQDENGKVRKNAIMAYSYKRRTVKTTALNDEADHILINGDFNIPLNEDMTLQNEKLMVFTKEEDAKEKYRSLMNSSLRAAKELKEKYDNTVTYLETALEEEHH